MFCPKCGKINPDNNEVCSGCNAQLHTEIEEKKPSKKGGWVKTALIILAVAVVVTVVVILLNGCGNVAVPEESMTF